MVAPEQMWNHSTVLCAHTTHTHSTNIPPWWLDGLRSHFEPHKKPWATETEPANGILNTRKQPTTKSSKSFLFVLIIFIVHSLRFVFFFFLHVLYVGIAILLIYILFFLRVRRNRNDDITQKHIIANTITFAVCRVCTHIFILDTVVGNLQCNLS